MLGCAPGTAVKGGMIFSDCGLVVDPSAEELAAYPHEAIGDTLETVLSLERRGPQK